MVNKQDIRVHTIKRYGWVPDLPDMRDHLYAAPMEMVTALPPTADLRPHCPPVYDQGQLGSCTGNAIAGAVQFEREKQQLKPDFVPSRLFIYYGERVIEGTVSTDSGAQIRDGIKVVAKQGVPPETDWPYDIAKFAAKPPAKAFTDGLKDRAATYSRVTQSLSQMKGCLASGYPFVFGFTVYDSFESAQVAKTGIVPRPPVRASSAVTR
jgi:C1A family cysteine protease